MFYYFKKFIFLERAAILDEVWISPFNIALIWTNDFKGID